MDKDIRQQCWTYGPTFAAEFVTMFCQIVAYKLAAHYLGKEGFSEFAVARRTISFLSPVALMGLGVALPRYLGHASGQRPARLPPFYGATVQCVLLMTLLLGTLINLFPGRFAYLFLGSRQFSDLALPMSVLFAGLVFHSVVYAYFRGHLQMGTANTLQFFNQGVLPLVAFFVFGSTVRSVLLGSGVLILAGSAVGFAMTPVGEVFRVGFAEAKELLIYGVPRVAGDFALMALMTLPVTIFAHVRGVQEAGFVSTGITALSVLAASFSSVGLILLPKASRMLAEGQYAELRIHVYRIVKVTVIVALAMNLILGIFARPLIRVYLGSQYSEVAFYVRLFAYGALPYTLYYVLRGLVDAYYRKAVNAINTLMSLVVLLVFSGAVLASHKE